MSSDDDIPPMIAPDENDPTFQAALAELKAAIQERFPEPEFSATPHEVPDPGIHLDTTVDVDDLDEVTDPIVSRLVDKQVEKGLPVYVIAIWSEWRIVEYLHRQKSGHLQKCPRS